MLDTLQDGFLHSQTDLGKGQKRLQRQQEQGDGLHSLRDLLLQLNDLGQHLPHSRGRMLSLLQDPLTLSLPSSLPSRWQDKLKNLLQRLEAVPTEPSKLWQTLTDELADEAVVQAPLLRQISRELKAIQKPTTDLERIYPDLKEEFLSLFKQLAQQSLWQQKQAKQQMQTLWQLCHDLPGSAAQQHVQGELKKSATWLENNIGLEKLSAQLQGLSGAEITLAGQAPLAQSALLQQLSRVIAAYAGRHSKAQVDTAHFDQLLPLLTECLQTNLLNQATLRAGHQLLWRSSANLPRPWSEKFHHTMQHIDSQQQHFSEQHRALLTPLTEAKAAPALIWPSAINQQLQQLAKALRQARKSALDPLNQQQRDRLVCIDNLLDSVNSLLPAPLSGALFKQLQKGIKQQLAHASVDSLPKPLQGKFKGLLSHMQQVYNAWQDKHLQTLKQALPLDMTAADQQRYEEFSQQLKTGKQAFSQTMGRQIQACAAADPNDSAASNVLSTLQALQESIDNSCNKSQRLLEKTRNHLKQQQHQHGAVMTLLDGIGQLQAMPNSLQALRRVCDKIHAALAQCGEDFLSKDLKRQLNLLLEELNSWYRQQITHRHLAGFEHSEPQQKKRQSIQRRLHQLIQRLQQLLQQSQQQKSRKTLDRPEHKQESEQEEVKEIYLGNAGLALLWPHIPRYLQRLDLLLEDEAFVDQEAQQRAVLLLQYLVTEETHFSEADLVLNKLLCGFELSDSLPLQLEISEQEQSSTEGLLTAVINQWEALSKPSIAGFRQSFLQREGKLTEKEKKWLLQVEQQGYDILLARLPWGLGRIKLPWMEKILQVDW